MGTNFRVKGLGFCIVSLLSLTAASSANALVIDQATFKKNGGDPSNVMGSIQAANKKLGDISRADAWLSVGNLELVRPGYRGRAGQCTATWIGNQDGSSYFLTAAHCFDINGGTEATVSGHFTDWRGRTVAQGAGVAYVTSAKIRKGVAVMPQALAQTASSQIAIVKLPFRNWIMDHTTLMPLQQPVLDDAANETGRDTMWIGYGDWGVGPNMTMMSGYPQVGSGRLYGRSQVDSVSADGRGLTAQYQPAGPSSHWAQIASGDDGAAWWQIHDGQPTIVAVTDAGTFNLSAAARVSSYVDWIKSIYPSARFLSAAQPQGCIINTRFGAKYCLPAGQDGYDGKWPAWFSGQDVYVQADSGVSVQLSDRPRMDGEGRQRAAEFFGTVDNAQLKHVKANNGQYLDFSRPSSMRVTLNSKPLGCVVSLESAQKYCLPAGGRTDGPLPAWIRKQDVFVQADPGVAVRLSDRQGFAHDRVATFSGTVEHDKLLKVRADNGEDLDFSQPVSMEVIQH